VKIDAQTYFIKKSLSMTRGMNPVSARAAIVVGQKVYIAMKNKSILIYDTQSLK